MGPSDLVTRWTVPAGERRALVAVCSSERMVHRETVKSLVDLAWGGQTIAAARHHGFTDVAFAWFDKGVRVDGLRNQACAQAIRERYTHLLFLDADNVWPTDILDKMLAHHGRGVVSALYFLKRWPYWPVALRDPQPNGTGGTDYSYDWQAGYSDELRREDLVGMGCTIIPVAILQRMTAPWFYYKHDANGQPTVTEDVAFCEQALRLNCPVWLDPSLKLGHVSVQVVTEPWYHRGLLEHQALEKAKQDGSAA